MIDFRLFQGQPVRGREIQMAGHSGDQDETSAYPSQHIFEKQLNPFKTIHKTSPNMKPFRIYTEDDMPRHDTI